MSSGPYQGPRRLSAVTATITSHDDGPRQYLHDDPTRHDLIRAQLDRHLKMAALVRARRRALRRPCVVDLPDAPEAL